MMLLLSLALAVPVDRTLCLAAVVDYDDVGLPRAQEDFWPTNSDKPLLGVRFQHRDTGTAAWKTVHTDTTGANAGCAVISVDPAIPQDVRVSSLADIGNHTLAVRNSTTSQLWVFNLPTMSFATPGTYLVKVNPGAPHRALDVLAAASYALVRDDGNLGGSFDPRYFLTDDTGPSPTKKSSRPTWSRLPSAWRTTPPPSTPA